MIYSIVLCGKNILSAEKYGKLKVCLPENRQIVLSPGPTVFKLKKTSRIIADLAGPSENIAYVYVLTGIAQKR